MSETAAAPAFEGWATLELMGHRKLGGYVREVNLFGAALCRIDVPDAGGQGGATQFYTASAIYCVTPTTEELARRVAGAYRPEPVVEYQLPKPVDAPPRRVREARHEAGDEDARPYRVDDDDDMGF